MGPVEYIGIERAATFGANEIPFSWTDQLTGPRKLVHGERESFIGGHGWQRSGPSDGSPGPNVGGGGT